VHRDKIQPVGVELNKDNSLAFVALGPANHLAVVDTTSYEVVKYILVGKRVWHMAFSPDYKYLFSTNGVSGDVSVIDLDKLEAIKAIKVGRFPWGIAARPTSK
jgi:YVTN family beta-propeller protein